MQAAGSNGRTQEGREGGKDAAIFGQIQMPLTRTPFVGESLQGRLASRSALPLPLLLSSSLPYLSPLCRVHLSLCVLWPFPCSFVSKPLHAFSPIRHLTLVNFLASNGSIYGGPLSTSPSLPPFCILFLFAGRGNRVLLRWARMVTCRDSCFNLL